MSKDHEKNPGNRKKPWSEHSLDKGHHPDDNAMRYEEYGSERNGSGGCYPGNPSSHSIGRSETSSDNGFHSTGRARSPSRGISEDADLSDAMVYLNKIKEEYGEDMVTYDNFLETMRDFKFGKVDAEEVCKAVRVLFKNKPHLIEKFNEYLPPHLRSHVDRPQESVRSFDRQILGAPPQFIRPMYMSGGKPPAMSVGMSMPLPPPSMQMQVPLHAPQSGIHQSYNSPIPPRMHSPMRMPTGQLAKQPSGYRQSLEDIEKVKAKQAQDFIQKVKRRYTHHPNVYKTFVELLQAHETKSDSFDKMKAEVNSLLWESPDLCEDFERNFMPIKRECVSGENEVLQKIKELLKKKNLLEDFLKCINYFNQKFISKKDLICLIEPFLRDEELVKGFKAFINYKEPTRDTSKNLDKYRKEGSYRILPECVVNDRQDPIAKEVLNMTCISCPTFESEDSNYVFLKRNIHEEALFRVEDERSECGLVIERIQYFINALEQVLATNKECELSMKDLKMSSGVVKEVLKSVYDRSTPEVLEGILTKPQVAIPVVIKRFYALNKQLRSCLRDKRKIWREVVERNYYKALDAVGLHYKTAEKNVFTMKGITGVGEEGLRSRIADQDIINDVKHLCEAYVKTSQADNKKAVIPNLYPTLDLVFEKFNMHEFDFVSDFPLFCAFRFIILVYERLLEIKEMEFSPIKSSDIAVAIDLQREVSIENRYSAVLETCLEFMRKNIDGYVFEDRIRELTDCRGFRLYNMKKMMSKIEKQVVALLESQVSMESLEGKNTFGSGEDLYNFRKVSDTIEIKTIAPKRDENWSEYVEKFGTLTPCEEIRPECPFLPRVCKKPPIIGYMKQNLKVFLNPGTYRIRHVTGSESFYADLRFYSRKG